MESEMIGKAVGKHIAAALLEVQRNLDPAKKNAQNPHLKNRYSDVNSVLDALRPACNMAGVVIVQRPISEDGSLLLLETMAIHAESGEYIAGITPMPLPKADPQGYGSALTYARRYGLLSFFSMQTEDDDAERAMQRPGVQKQAQSPRPNKPEPQKAPVQDQSNEYNRARLWNAAVFEFTREAHRLGFDVSTQTAEGGKKVDQERVIDLACRVLGLAEDAELDHEDLRKATPELEGFARRQRAEQPTLLPEDKPKTAAGAGM